MKVYSPSAKRYIEVEVLDQESAVPPTKSTSTSKKRKSFKTDFVMIPLYWIEALEGTKNAHAFTLAMRLLAERHKRKYVGGDVVISSETVPGMSRMARWRSTKKLVQLGIIEIAKPTNHSAPRVTAFHTLPSDTPPYHFGTTK
jgi:hypothetical protein